MACITVVSQVCPEGMSSTETRPLRRSFPRVRRLFTVKVLMRYSTAARLSTALSPRSMEYRLVLLSQVITMPKTCSTAARWLRKLRRAYSSPKRPSQRRWICGQESPRSPASTKVWTR